MFSKTSALVAAAVAFLATAGTAEAIGGPFDQMSGAWSGGGAITLASGVKEQIRCRANYDVSGSNLALTIRCASASYKFELQSNVAHSGGAISGTWAEMTHRVGGTISGSASGNRINARVEGVLSAMLSVSTNAGKQSISIEAPGMEMSRVAISMSKAGQ
jgi:hypothetical protein